MSSQKYLAAIAALVIAIGAVWFYSNGRDTTVAPSLSQSNRSETKPLTVPLQKDPNAQPSKPLAVEATSASPQDLQRLKVLEEILISKNDNDPRLDSEFRGLSPASKKLMEERYHALAPEKRNERGTIAFLVGREISTTDDVAFMANILTETPCMSLADCSREEKAPSDPHAHAETGMAITLAYPQMVALHSLENQINQAEKGAKPGYWNDVKKALEDASRSPVPVVADKARGLLSRIKNLPG